MRGSANIFLDILTSLDLTLPAYWEVILNKEYFPPLYFYQLRLQSAGNDKEQIIALYSRLIKYQLPNFTTY